MVKRYYRLSIDSIVLQIATLSFVVGGVYFSSLCTIAIISQASRDNNEWAAVFATAVLYFGTLLFVYVELTFLIGNICLDTDHISVRGDIKIGREKIQYPASIGYGDIVDIEIIPLRKNSRNQSALLSRPIPYMVLIDKKGKKHRFGLHFMPKITVMHLLEELLKRCKEVGGIQFDPEKLINDFSLARLAVK